MSIETRTKIASVTVGAGGISIIDINNIPQTYSDLIVEFSLRTSYNGMADMYLRFSDAGGSTQYTYIRTGSNGIAQESTTASSVDNFVFAGGFGANAPANYFGNGTIYIPDYTNSRPKTLLSRHGSSMGAGSDSARLGMNAMYFNSTSPITRLYFSVAVGWAQNSTISVYGVNNAKRTAGNSIKAIGGNIEFDGTYVYHTFNSAGTFTPLTNLLVDYLVVAGGGGGGGSNGATSGAGGGGGYRTSVGTSGGGASAEAKLSLINGTGYAVTVGAGGSAGTASDNVDGGNGSNSSFWTITATGGGGGGAGGGGAARNGLAGGSGGGAGNQGTSSLGGAGTANQGYAGGNQAPGNRGGGGGGAGGVGGNATNTIGGNGGVGVLSPITNKYYAGGGGGGCAGESGSNSYGPAAGGIGGGGLGGGWGSVYSTPGQVGTGGGGGGGERNSASTGGSGIVIIRYKG